MIRQWAAILDVAIYLDAPDTVLMERINVRAKCHAVKGRPEQDMHKFLVRGRSSIEKVLGKLTADDGPELLRFDTAQESPNQIAARVLASLGLEPSEDLRNI
jgi:hypothetical protein